MEANLESCMPLEVLIEGGHGPMRCFKFYSIAAVKETPSEISSGTCDK